MLVLLLEWLHELSAFRMMNTARTTYLLSRKYSSVLRPSQELSCCGSLAIMCLILDMQSR